MPNALIWSLLCYKIWVPLYPTVYPTVYSYLAKPVFQLSSIFIWRNASFPCTLYVSTGILLSLLIHCIPWSRLSKIAFYLHMHVCMLNCFQSCPTLCNPMGCSPPGSSVPGILQARILEWAAMPSSRESSQSRDWTHVSYASCIGRWVLYN